MTEKPNKYSNSILLRSGKSKRKKWRPCELEDQSWFPDILRDYQTIFLATLDRVLGLYQPLDSLLNKIDPPPRRIVDLASGSGESAVRSTGRLRAEGTELLLTDKYPVKIGKYHSIYLKTSLDASSSVLPPADLYTMFNAFHHFGPGQRLDIALKATKNGGRFLAIEPLRPRVSVFLKVFISTLIGPILLAPFMRPFSPWWLVFTYMLPLGILATWWDGMASVFRSLNQAEWEELENELKRENRSVEEGLIPTTMAELKYFLAK